MAVARGVVFGVLFMLTAGLQATFADGFVEEVSCSSDSLTVVLNRSDPDLQRFMQSSLSQPVAYVYGHKSRTPCGVSLKTAQGLPVYNLTVPYGQACSVFLTDLKPDYQTAETTIALEDNYVVDPSKPMRINHVFCLYTQRVQTLKIKDVSTGHEVIASTGGKPKPKVDMTFRTPDGRPVNAAKFGDTLQFYLALSPDQAYKGIAPKHCMFSDREDIHQPIAKKLTFVQNNCPVSELSEIIDPLRDVNEEVYYTQFRTFRFGNRSTVYVHCTVQVCLDQASCTKSCFEREFNSTLNFEQLRYHRTRRQRRDVDPRGLNFEEVHSALADDELHVTNELVILDERETIALSRSPGGIGGGVIHCAPSKLFNVYHAIIGSLLLVCLLSGVYIGCMWRKMRLQTKDLETRTVCSSLVGGYSGAGGGASLPRLGASLHQPNYQHFGSMRSVSELSAPRSVWMPEHQIPRIR